MNCKFHTKLPHRSTSPAMRARMRVNVQRSHNSDKRINTNAKKSAPDRPPTTMTHDEPASVTYVRT